MLNDKSHWPDPTGPFGAALARRVKRHKPSLEWFKIKVTATSVNITHRGPGLSGPEPDGSADTVIHMEGAMDHPVLKRSTALVYVFCAEAIGDNSGTAIGATTAWQVVLRLPREQFADLLAVVVAERLAEVDLLLDGVKYGKGAVRSVSFYTEPVPSERDEDTGDA
jgi:hypothetical protein